MAKKVYIGVNGTAKKIKKAYIGVNGVAKKIKKAYIGVNGVARLCFSGATTTFQIFNVTGSGNAGNSGTTTITRNLTLDHTPIGEVSFRYDINSILEELLDISIVPDHDNVVKLTLKIKGDSTRFLHPYSYDLTIRIQYDYED